MGELPLDDPRWYPMQAAFELLERQTGAWGFAFADLEQTLTSGKLRSMRRDIASGKRELLSAAFWTPIRLMMIDAQQGWGRINGGMFYVWRPDFDRLYSGSAKVDHDDNDLKEPLRAIDRAKAALRDLYPTKAQRPGVLKDAWRKVVAECEKRHWQPPSEDTVQRALEELGYRPPRKRQPTPRKRKRR